MPVSSLRWSIKDSSSTPLSAVTLSSSLFSRSLSPFHCLRNERRSSTRAIPGWRTVRCVFSWWIRAEQCIPGRHTRWQVWLCVWVSRKSREKYFVIWRAHGRHNGRSVLHRNRWSVLHQNRQKCICRCCHKHQTQIRVSNWPIHVRRSGIQQ